MPGFIAAILDNRAVSFLGRVILTFMFWESGLEKVFAWNEGVTEMTRFGLAPPEIYNGATLAVQLIGSALVIWGPYYWLGAGALAVFTLLTIPVVNPFWGGVPEPKATLNLISAVHNVSYCGGLLLACILRRYERKERRI